MINNIRLLILSLEMLKKIKSNNLLKKDLPTVSLILYINILKQNDI